MQAETEREEESHMGASQKMEAGVGARRSEAKGSLGAWGERALRLRSDCPDWRRRKRRCRILDPSAHPSGCTWSHPGKAWRLGAFMEEGLGGRLWPAFWGLP